MMEDNPESFGQLRQQVVSLERGHNELRKEFHILDQKMDAGFAKIADKLDAKSVPQWPAYTLIVTIIFTIGGALYYPVTSSLTKQEVALERLREITVPRSEHERLWREQTERERRQWDEIMRQGRDAAYLQGQLHPMPK